ncbi:hypothetical protein PP707_05510 [Acetobacter pasteurianus]|nr:hypothetical protein [Acetobacter pasteurianus]
MSEKFARLVGRGGGGGGEKGSGHFVLLMMMMMMLAQGKETEKCKTIESAQDNRWTSHINYY